MSVEVAAFAPVQIEVLNESSNHRAPPGSESHFKVVLVTAAFEGDRLIARHRRVNAALAAELAGGVHALTHPRLPEIPYPASGNRPSVREPFDRFVCSPQ